MHDVLTYHGDVKPTWNPSCEGFEPCGRRSFSTGSGLYVFDDVLGTAECQSLIDQFEQQEAYPVGIDGYSNGDPAREGSRRAMAWATDLAPKITQALKMPPELTRESRNLAFPGVSIPTPFPLRHRYKCLGATPWMRFMRYRGGGMHVPHYDAPFHCEIEQYITLFSWVLYLNTVPREHGATFDFVDDGHRNHPRDRGPEAFLDWTRMATDEEIVLSLNPRRGRLLVFPHWLCHQVGQYTGQDARYIIRGDLAYGYGTRFEAA